MRHLVSIHAPVWGATISRLLIVLLDCFNPRTRVGCDVRYVAIKPICEFQSTHPCGVRRLQTFKACPTVRFNPRTRVGCDTVARNGLITRFVSIHAPVWGATC